MSRITVAIACFNAADTIGRAIESALAQRWPDVEVLVADDTSTDGSAERVRQHARSDGRVRLVRRTENGGPGATRQTLVEEATGEFIAFFDDDDESDPERLASQHARLLRAESDCGSRLVACYASGQRRYPNGHVIDLPAIGSRPGIPSGEPVADYLLFGKRRPDLFYGAGTPTCALMMRTETVRALGGFDPDMRRVEDADLAVRLALAGGQFVGCPEVLFRQHATFASDKAPQRNYAAECQLIDKHRVYLERRGRYTYARRWMAVRYHHFRGDRAGVIRELGGLLLRHPLATSAHVVAAAPRRFMHEWRAGLRRRSR